MSPVETVGRPAVQSLTCAAALPTGGRVAISRYALVCAVKVSQPHVSPVVKFIGLLGNSLSLRVAILFRAYTL